MTMRTEDMKEIIQGTVNHFLTRCDHRRVEILANEINQLVEALEKILNDKVDNSADTGGDWDNA
jgi:hypothetical protein